MLSKLLFITFSKRLADIPTLHCRQPETVFVLQMFVPENGQSWQCVGCLLFQVSRACAPAHMIFITVSNRDVVSHALCFFLKNSCIYRESPKKCLSYTKRSVEIYRARRRQANKQQAKHDAKWGPILSLCAVLA